MIRHMGQPIPVPRTVTAVLIRMKNSGNGTGDGSDDPGNGGIRPTIRGTNEDPGT
ncbi:MAG: hypothetical protein ACLUTA_04945 [Blautia wexlerae]